MNLKYKEQCDKELGHHANWDEFTDWLTNKIDEIESNSKLKAEEAFNAARKNHYETVPETGDPCFPWDYQTYKDWEETQNGKK